MDYKGDESNFTLYMSSLYWAQATTITVGFGDIYGTTDCKKKKKIKKKN
jgi:hypothetical protein